MVIKSPTRKIPTTLKEIEEMKIPTDGAKYKLDGVVESAPLDEGCEVLDGKVNDGQWGKNDNRMLLLAMTPTFSKKRGHYKIL